MSIPEEEREKVTESLFEEIFYNEIFPNIGKKLDIKVQETNETPNYLNVKRPALRHIILKKSKVNDKEFPR